MKEITKNLKDFIIGGNATFTIKNDVSGVRYTFNVRKAKDSDVFFVRFLSGNDNEWDFTYMGIIMKNQYRLTKNSRVKFDSVVNKAFAWVWNAICKGLEFPKSFHFYHEGVWAYLLE